MHQVFSDLPELIQNTNELAKRCNFYLKTGKINLPTYATPNKKILIFILPSRQNWIEVQAL